MKRPILLAALLVSATLFTRSDASLVDSHSRLAKVSVLRLNREVKWDSRATPRRLVLIALEDCLLSIDGKSNLLEAGDYKEVDRGSNLTIDSTGPRPTQLVLIEVLSASQPPTVGSTTLASHEQLEDASDRNPTLLVAVSSLRLNDVRDWPQKVSRGNRSICRQSNFRKAKQYGSSEVYIGCVTIERLLPDS